MFVRNGQVLGSVQVDPSTADPQVRKVVKAAKAEETVVDVPPEPVPEPAPVVEPELEPTPEPEAEAPKSEPKKAPAKKATPAFKSALDK